MEGKMVPQADAVRPALIRKTAADLRFIPNR